MDTRKIDLRLEQRLLARIVDILFYHLLWLFLYHIVCQVPFEQHDYYFMNQLVAAFILQLFLEPTMIACLGGTLGHFLIGMRVHTYEGTKLTWGQAFGRLCLILGKSPIIVSRRPVWQSESYKEWYGDYWPLNKDKGFPWDEDTTYSFVDERAWRGPAVVACGTAMLLTIGVIFSGADVLKHRGPMTVAEFAENYNTYVETKNGAREYKLNAQGQWEKVSNGPAYEYMDDGPIGHETRFPQLVYTEKDGYLTGLSFEIHHQSTSGEMIPDSRRILCDLTMAYAVPYVEHQAAAYVESQINQWFHKSYSLEMGELTVSWEIKTQGYTYQRQRGKFVAEEYPYDFTYSYDLIFEIRPTE